MDWFSLSLLCAISLATADALTKKYLSSYSGKELLLIRFTVPGILLCPLLFYFPLPDAPLAFWGWVAILLPLELLAMLLYMLAIRDAPLSKTLPYLAFTPVFNILTGWIFLNESVNLLGGFGIILVVVGAYLLNLHQLQKDQTRDWLDPLKAIFYEQGSRRMLMVAIIYSLTSVIGKVAMQYVGPLSFGPFYFALLGLVTFALLTLFSRNSLTVLRHNIRWHFIIGGLMAVMIITHFLAISMIEAAYMITVKRTSLLFGILYGAWLFRETDLARNLSTVALMVTGVAFILLA